MSGALPGVAGVLGGYAAGAGGSGDYAAGAGGYCLDDEYMDAAQYARLRTAAAYRATGGSGGASVVPLATGGAGCAAAARAVDTTAHGGVLQACPQDCAGQSTMEKSWKNVPRSFRVMSPGFTRMKSLMAGTIFSVFTITARVFRVAFNTLIILPKAAGYFLAANRYVYNVKGATKEVFKRYADEWVDLGVALLTVPLALTKVVYKPAFKGSINDIYDYYLGRQKRKEDFDKTWSDAKALHKSQKEAKALAKQAAKQAQTQQSEYV